MGEEPKQSARSRQRKAVEQAAELIASRLDDPPRLEEIAGRFGFSASYFQRLFVRHLSESPDQYARRLRLERAKFLLRDPRRSVTDAAFDSFYEAHESFTRAFRAHFGMSPSDYRKLEQLRTRESTVPFEVVRLERTRLACIRQIGPYDRAAAAFDQLADWAEARSLLTGRTLFGLYWDDQTVTDETRTRCDAAIAVPPELELDAPVRERWLPSGHYAFLLHSGPASVKETYDNAFRHWFPERGWRPEPRPTLIEHAMDGSGDARLFVAVTRD